ncbi:MAG: hypothetical protein C4532_17100 [Candidatus Abyssobacteria bacterium SURF_17]|jgi:hypothetical protein|uniref:Uncharacterized protein n=1 Tax=Candidatus Abyssobacteria bacterium SURF_17 TaxID=2093361 RepID=A0A419ERG4_9BACT|nr:MAG: hypothetical protein C4532_17100 [Candidatus Abyssubacteria bacterium SURF_17]
MKRYRIFNCDFDSRALILAEEQEWTSEIREQWQDSISKIKEGLIAEFGVNNATIKIGNFIDLGPAPFSVVSFHNKFFAQIRYAFTIGAYYPALTGACCLGERILNHLILGLRDDYKKTAEYKKVYRKDSIDNWDLAIKTLESWEILLPDVVGWFRELKGFRDRMIHFTLDTDKDDRQLSLSVIKKLAQIIDGQFPGSQFAVLRAPWFIEGIPGESYIKKSWENNPFVKRIYLPNCRLVGFQHKVVQLLPKLIVNDDFPYKAEKISDSEFAELRNSVIS